MWLLGCTDLPGDGRTFKDSVCWLISAVLLAQTHQWQADDWLLLQLPGAADLHQLWAAHDLGQGL